MKIVQYVEFTTPTEKEELEALMKDCKTELEFRSRVSKTFGLSAIEAGIVLQRFRKKFNQLKKQ